MILASGARGPGTNSRNGPSPLLLPADGEVAREIALPRIVLLKPLLWHHGPSLIALWFGLVPSAAQNGKPSATHRLVGALLRGCADPGSSLAADYRQHTEA